MNMKVFISGSKAWNDKTLPIKPRILCLLKSIKSL